MTEKRPFEFPQECLRDLVAWFDANDIRGVVIGGVAVSMLGYPRFTDDVDALLLVDEEAWPSLLVSGAKFGFRPRVGDPLDFAATSRVLLVRHPPTGMEVDLSLGTLPFEEAVLRRSKRTRAENINLPLPNPADLIILKAVANRPQDWADVDGLLSANPRVSLPRIRRYVREFAEVLETQDIVTTLEQLLARRRKPKSRR